MSERLMNVGGGSSDESRGAFEEDWLRAMRSVMRAADAHSRWLRDALGVTMPQLLVLRLLSRVESLTAGHMARELRLSQPTLKVVLDKLESKKLVKRRRSQSDRRTIRVAISDRGRQLVVPSPPLLPDGFRARLLELPEWERTQMLSSIQRVASLLDTPRPATTSAA